MDNGNTNYDHDSKAQEFCVAAMWFSATKEDVPVSPTRVRCFAPAYSCALTRARVFSPSFAQITNRASSSFVTITYWVSSFSLPALTPLGR